jgi:hypothetical protein
MIVPTFWAEGRLQDRINGRQVTVRRFGWSDESQSAAQENADARVREALARIVAGETIPRRDLKRAYNGSEGVPIREEIVDRHGDVILTRNSYGALCLNTPDVLFADIDFDDQTNLTLLLPVLGVLLGGAVAIGWSINVRLGIVAALIALVICYPIAAWLHRLLLNAQGGPEQRARKRIAEFLNGHSDWHVRLYQTPAGLRVLVMHKTFDPTEAAVAECFRALGADPIYARMCIRQRCFRARVSPKPWRIGIRLHLRPATVWPVDPARLPERRRWIEAYEQAAQQYASCRFMEAMGSGVVHPAVADVQRIHDELCRAKDGIPIA